MIAWAVPKAMKNSFMGRPFILPKYLLMTLQDDISVHDRRPRFFKQNERIFGYENAYEPFNVYVERASKVDF